MKTLEDWHRAMPRYVPEEMKKYDLRYQIMDFEPEEMKKEIWSWDREQIIYWLEWNDQNGIYSDQDAINEGIPVFTTESARNHMFNLLLESR